MRAAMVKAGLAAVAVASIGFGGGWFAHASTVPTRIEIAATACDDNGSISVGDGGKTMTLEAVPAVHPLPEVVLCVLRVLDAPTAVTFRIEHTLTRTDWQQTSWGGYTASWTHDGQDGQDGLNMIIEAG